MFLSQKCIKETINVFFSLLLSNIVRSYFYNAKNKAIFQIALLTCACKSKIVIKINVCKACNLKGLKILATLNIYWHGSITSCVFKELKSKLLPMTTTLLEDAAKTHYTQSIYVLLYISMVYLETRSIPTCISFTSNADISICVKVS